MKRNRMHLEACLGLVTLLSVPSTTWAQVAPPLGTAAQFAVLANSGVTGAAGAGVVINGDVGSSPTATISNFPPSSTVPPFIVHGTNDGVVQQARIDAIAAYNNLLAQGPGVVLPDNLGGGVTLVSGIYSFATGTPNLPAGQTLTLNGGGVFVFNVGAALTFNATSVVAGTANPCNIFWRVGTSATLNGVNFRGTVIANASITVGAGSNVSGRLLAGTGATGAVTMAGAGGNTIGGCSSAPAACPITLSPTVLPNGTVGVPYSATITGSTGVAPYTFTVPPGTLPTGLALTSAGVLSGTPTDPVPQTFTITGTDSIRCSSGRSYTVFIVSSGTPPPPGCPPLALAPTTLPNGTVGVAYSQTFTGSGGTAPYTFTQATGGPLPSGLTLTPAGVLSGTPANNGTFDFNIRGTDANGCFTELSYVVSSLIGVPTLPQAFVVLLALGLAGVGYFRLRRQARAD